MNVIEWRKNELRVCIEEFIPAVLNDFANTCGLELKSWSIQPISSRHSTYGFHFSNVVLLEWFLSNGQRMVVKLPVPNEDDLFIVNDSKRILTNELPDMLVSFRTVNGQLSMRLQGSLFAIVCDETGMVKISQEKYPLWVLFHECFTREELKELGLLFKVGTGEGVPLRYNPSQKLLLNTKLDLLSPIQRLVATSHIYTPRTRGELRLSAAAKKYIETSLLDPITRCIYKVNDLKSLLKFVLKSVEGKPRSALTGSNLEFKRVRSYELVVVTLYEKLREISKQVKHQKKLRVSSDFLLKKMFVSPPLQRLFEYYDQTNLFKEISLRYKVIIPLDYVPYDLRDVHQTFAYNICVYDTPDDDGIGVKLQLAIDCELDKYGRFIRKKGEGIV